MVPRTGPGPIDLAMFVGDNSWSFFDITKIKAEGFIEKPIDEWPLHEDYERAKQIIENFNVANDLAERGVKLVSDYLNSDRKEENLQNILQVAENNRNIIPNQRKREVASSWCPAPSKRDLKEYSGL